MSRKELTEEEKILVTEYLKDLNQTRAYCVAYNYEGKHATSAAYHKFRQDHIQQAVQNEHAKRNARTYMDADKVLNKIAIILNSDITDYWDDLDSFMTLKNLKKLPKEITECIQSIESKIDPTGTVHYKIKLESKMDALKMAAKHLGLLIDRQAIGSDPLLPPLKVEGLTLGYPRDDYTLAEWEMACKELEKTKEIEEAKEVKVEDVPDNPE